MIVVEALRVDAAFSEGRGEGCVWRASKDLIFFFSARSESECEEALLQNQARRGISTEPSAKSHFYRELNLRSMSTELNLNTISHRESEVSSTYYAR